MNAKQGLMIAVAVVLLLSGGWYWQQKRSLATLPEQDGGPMVVVSVPDLSEEARDGEAAFQDSCAACHGDKADGRNGMGPPLVHKIYEPNHHGDGAFLLAVTRGVRAHHWPFGNMPPVENVSEQDVGKIVTYVRTLQRANGIY